MTVPPAAGSSASRLQSVAGALSRLIDRIADASLVARGLSDAVDWQARAARVFHDRAIVWAGDVSGLACVAETVRLDVLRARDRAAFAEALPGLPLTAEHP